MNSNYCDRNLNHIRMDHSKNDIDILIRTPNTTLSARDLFKTLNTKYTNRFRGAIIYSETIIKNTICQTKSLMNKYFGDKYLVIWAMKSAPIEKIAQIIGQEQIAFDVGSYEEFLIANRITNGNRIFYTSSGKYDWDINAIIEHNCVPIFDNITELKLINKKALESNKNVTCGIRINLMEDEAYSDKALMGFKFGIHGDLQQLIHQLKTLTQLDIKLLHMHIGTQLSIPSYFDKAIHKQLKIFDIFRSSGVHIDMIDVGGGFPFNYYIANDSAASADSGNSFTSHISYPIEAYIERIHSIFTSYFNHKMPIIAIEPGRHIVAGSAFAIGYVLHCKPYDAFNWLISSISSNDIYHKSVTPDIHYDIYSICDEISETIPTSIGGPLCYFGDIITPINVSIPLNSKINRGDILLINHVGAYSVTGSGNFHNMPRLPILMLDHQSNLIEIRPQEAPYFE